MPSLMLSHALNKNLIEMSGYLAGMANFHRMGLVSGCALPCHVAAQSMHTFSKELADL